MREDKNQKNLEGCAFHDNRIERNYGEAANKLVRVPTVEQLARTGVAGDHQVPPPRGNGNTVVSLNDDPYQLFFG